ncbi:MAG: NAD(P)/FAD-dependent oxidoreductase [Flavobacteriaceae bacterium]|nr:NAD(P)/FAD-dependent oxidoreductase [Flavobacteriaceae bacterium]
MSNQEHIAIIGNGIAGVTLARHIRKNSNKRISLISDESPYFFSRTALMYVYMGHMKWEHLMPYENSFWKKNRIDLVQNRVVAIHSEENKLIFQDQQEFIYDQLVIATGSIPNKLGWPGENLNGVQGLYSKQDLERLEEFATDAETCKSAVIVGGGLIGVELAEMLHTRNIPVTFLVREPYFWNNVLPKHSAELITKHIQKHGIDLRLSVHLEAIKTDGAGKAKSVIIKETQEEISCDFVGLTAGVKPNIEFLKASEITTNKGVVVDEYFRTNIKNIYAIGDCAERNYSLGNRPPIEAVWYTGRIMGETLAQTLCGNPKKYNPGNWFNSAKFFDIEYQTYGWVFPTPKEGNAHFYWKHETEEKAIEIEYNRATQEFVGINSFGIRLRHEFFDQCLKAGKTISFVIEYLKQANFDPEFFDSYEQEIKNQWKNENRKLTH